MFLFMRRCGGIDMPKHIAGSTSLFIRIIAICLALACAVPLFAEPSEAEAGDSCQIWEPAPSASKKTVYQKDGVTIDYGHASQGYVMVKHKKTDKELKVWIILGKKVYTYALDGCGEFEVFPLQMGNGKYEVQVYRKEKKNVVLIASKTISVALDSPGSPYLYPSQYVDYTTDSKAVAKSMELCKGLSSDREKVRAIYAFCGRQIAYDYKLARSLKGGYLPDVDSVLDKKKGICFDYAALMACMLRVQGIPTQLVIGYADKAYHAWNHVLLDGKTFRYDATYASMGNRADTYTEERRY